MTKFILNKEQIGELILQNKYQVDPEKKFVSRCIDGRYENKKDLSALAFPGADAGEMALILATANSYGFQVNLNKAYQSLFVI